MSAPKPSSSRSSASKSGSGSSEKPSVRQSSFSQSAPAAGASRHVACKACRERKVRCGGGLPNPCPGCQKRNQECTYPISRNNDAATEEISETIKTLAARLARAEAEIAGQKSLAFTSPPLISGTGSPSNGSIAGLSLTDLGVMSSRCSSQNGSLSVNDFACARPSSSHITGPETTNTLPLKVQDALHQRFFDAVQLPFPMIHKDRYMAKISIMPMKDEICALVYAVLTHAAMTSVEYSSAENICYVNCRRHLEQAELGNLGGEMLTLEAAQACLLVALYEFKRMYFTRAWLSTGRALRIVQMLRLHKLPNGITSFQHDATTQMMNSQPPTDWMDDLEEERRRVFWVAFALDRFSNTGTDWPMTLDDAEISTLLPSPFPLEADEVQRNNATPPLSMLAVLSAPAAPSLSPFAGVTVMAHLWGRCATHLYTVSRTGPLGESPDTASHFWARHYDIDGAVTRAMNTCCAHLALSDNPHQINISGFNSPVSAGAIGATFDSNTLFLNLVAQTVIIYLHMAASKQAEVTGLPPGVQDESETRCKMAAIQIAVIVQRVTNPSIFAEMNFFAARCLYAAARVLVQTIKRLHGDARFFEELLHCLLSVMDTCKSANPLVEFYLEQLGQEFDGDVPGDTSYIPQ